MYYTKCNRCGRPKSRSIGSLCYKCCKPHYKVCKECGAEKKENTSRLCNPCNRIVLERRRERLRIHNKKVSKSKMIAEKSKQLMEKRNDIVKRITQFVDMIEGNHLYIDLYDISNMIDLYYEITFREYEFDPLPPAEQVLRMWGRLKDFKEKFDPCCIEK